MKASGGISRYKTKLSGPKSTELQYETPLTSGTETASPGSSLNSSIDEDMALNGNEQDDSALPQFISEQRRELNQAKLNNYNQEKL